MSKVLLMRLSEKLKQKHTDFFIQVHNNFSSKTVAKKELISICNSATLAQKTTQQITELFYKKEQIKRQVANIKWQNMVQVYARAPQTYSYFSTLEEALEYFKEGVDFIYAAIKPYLPGPSVFFPEICYEQDQFGIKKYLIHVHIMCDADAYDVYKLATKSLHYRVGQNSNEHYISTRKKEKQRAQQSENNYCNEVANYNAKFTIHRDTKFSRRKEILPSAKINYTYAEQKLNFIQINCEKKDCIPKADLFNKDIEFTRNMDKYLNIQSIKNEYLNIRNQSINSRQNSYWKHFWADNLVETGVWPGPANHLLNQAQKNQCNTS